MITAFKIIPALTLALLGLLVTPDCVSARKAQPPPPPPFTSAESVMAWIAGYRANPEPQRLRDAVRVLISAGSLNDPDQAGMYFGFVAGVLGSNPEKARALINGLFPMAPEHQVLVVKAIAFSGLADWKEVLRETSERMPARTVLIDKYLYKDAPTLEKLPLDSGSFAMDANWGYFFATGSAAPVERIITALEWSADKNNVERLTLGSMAKWTLASNAQRSPDLMDICKTSLNHQKGATAVALRDLIDAAETYEIARIRKSAMAAIDELKTKGPQSSRTTQWWTQAGQTLLALGCVGASVLGQAQIGIPCVVGGALSTTAAKLFQP